MIRRTTQFNLKKQNLCAPPNVQKEYEGVLKYIVEPLIGKGESIDYVISTVGRQILGKPFLGVFPSDKIPISLSRTRPYSKFLIMNLDREGQPGSHWVGVVGEGKVLYVYDTFGRRIEEIAPSIFDFAAKHKMRVHNMPNSTSCAEQDARESNCGQRSLAWLIYFKTYGKHKALQISE
jgi:hypothetical protein